MHGASQLRGHSPKPSKSPSATQISPTMNSVQNSCSISSQVKGKKRDRLDQGSDSSKREHLHKPDDEDSGKSRSEPMLQSEIAKITNKGGLVDFEGVKKLIQLMQPVSADRKIDFSGRLMLVDVISATDRSDCLGWFVQLRGLPVLDDWLQQIHKCKVGDGNNSKEGDKSVEDYLFALLRALDKLPINLRALQTCNIGKSVNYLRMHKSADIRKKARSLVEIWKKRVEIEISMNDTKSGPSCGVSWPAKPAHSEGSQGGSQVGNKQSSGSVDTGNRNSVMQSSAAKSSLAKLGGECIGKLIAPSGSDKSITMSSVSCSKDTVCGKSVGNGSPELPLTTVKEERSSSSSQSQNNSQSCSSEHARTVGSFKEDARSSTTISVSKCTGVDYPDPKLSNGVNTMPVSVVQKETGSLKVFPVHKNSSAKSSPTRIPQEKFPEVPVADYGNNQWLIVKLPNTGCSPSRVASGSYSEDPSLGNGKSSPAANHANYDKRLSARKAALNPDACHGEDGLSGCNGGNALTARDGKSKAVEDSMTTIEESKGDDSLLAVKCPSDKLYDSSLSSMNALVESCVKFSEASASASPEDDVGMNLLASVAAGEILRSDNSSSLASPQRHSTMADESCSMMGLRYTGQELAQLHSQTNNGAANDQRGTYVLSLEKKEECGPILDMSCKIFEQTAKVESLRSDVLPSEVLCNSSIDGTKLKNESDMEVEGANNFHETRQAFLGCDKDVSASDSSLKVRSPMPEDDERHDDKSERVLESSASASSEPVAGTRKLVEDTNKNVAHSLSEVDVSLQHVAIKSLDGSVNKEKPFPSDAVHPDYMVRKNGDAHLPPSNRSCMETKDEAAGETEAGDLTTEEKLMIGIGSSFSDHNTGTGDNSAREEALVASSFCMCSSAAIIRENETSSSSSRSKLEKNESDGVHEGRVANGKPSSSDKMPVSKVKLDFDLNEGFPFDDASEGEVNKHAALGISSAVHLHCSLPISAPSTSACFSTSVTVAAATKGSFIPPVNPLCGKGELGWKGSAATSAFRPAEPRRTSDILVNVGESTVNDNAFVRQSRPIFDFDLNVADERVLEDVASLSFAQASCPKSGACDCGSGGLDLDLNRVDNPDVEPVFVSNGSRSEVSVVPRRTPLDGGLAAIASSASRDFDLNNGPTIDEVGAEIASRSQPIKSSMAFPSSMTGVRLNSAEFANFSSSWFSPTNSSSAITVPSMLPRSGEQSYIEATRSQKILAAPSSSIPFGLEMYRPTVLPSSAAIPFASTTPFPYSGFLLETSFPPSTSFSGTSTVYGDSAKGGSHCFPAIPSQLVGPSGVFTSTYSHPLIMNLPGVVNSVGADNKKWGSQIALNSGPGGNDSDWRDDRLTSFSRRHFISSPQLADEYPRAYQPPGGVATVGGSFKRKEPEGGWDST